MFARYALRRRSSRRFAMWRAEKQARLIDFSRIVSRRAPHGITGAESFLDHVHLKTQGYRLLALELFDALREDGTLQPSAEWDEHALARATGLVESRLDQTMHGSALHNLARVFVWARRFEEAEKLALQSLEAIGPNADTLNLLGLTASGRGNSEEAIGYYRRSLQVDPNYLQAHANLAAELLAINRIDDAITHGQSALKLHPEYAEAHVTLALAMASSERPLEAVRHYQHAVRMNPDYAEGAGNLGERFGLLGRNPSAIRLLEAALEQHSDSGALR